jgi:hypothetical protein
VESRSALESVVPHDAPVAQLDRACASEAQGRAFESPRARHFKYFMIQKSQIVHFELHNTKLDTRIGCWNRLRNESVSYLSQFMTLLPELPQALAWE